MDKPNEVVIEVVMRRIVNTWGSFAVSLGLLLGLVSISGCQKASDSDLLEAALTRGHLRVGATQTFPPYGYLDEKGQNVGFEIELIHLVAQKVMGKQEAVQLRETTSANWQSLLGLKQVDFLLASMSYNREWDKRYDYGETYYTSTFRILVRDKSGIKSVKDLSGKRVTFLFGGTSEGILKKTAPPDTKLVGFRTVHDEIEAFRKGEVDALAQQEAILVNVMKQGCDLRLLPEKLAQQPYAVMYQKGPQSAKMKAKVEAALADLKASGELARLEQAWLGEPKIVKCTGGQIF